MPHKFITEKISLLLKTKERVVVAIDGRCASGKSTLAERLKQQLLCNVFHMDDFFLRPEQRTEERLSEPGGNVDRERFMEEVLQPLIEGKTFSYRPYICKTSSFCVPVTVNPHRINIIEGSYSCHPDLWNFYDLHIFLDVQKDIQLERILKRNGKEKLEIFKTQWIPLEEKYFKAYDIENKCEITYNTNF